MTTSIAVTPSVATRRRWGAIVAASTLTAVTLAVIWFAAVPWGPLVCPAIYPAPLNCFAEQREGSALIASFIVLVLFIGTVLAAAWRGRTGLVLTGIGIAALAVAPVVAYLSIAWSPGFPL